MKSPIAAICMLPIAHAALASPVQWTSAVGGNDHFYEFVTTATNWDNAQADAQSRNFSGFVGHLLTLTSLAEKNFINDTLLSGRNTWLGAERLGAMNAFAWVVGPEAGQVFYDNGVLGAAYSSFWGGEPNGQFSGENKVEMWGNNWNDMPGNQARAYVVEYSPSQVSAVPLPATGLLLIAGLAALVLGRRRQVA